jgi:putative phosphoesterase
MDSSDTPALLVIADIHGDYTAARKAFAQADKLNAEIIIAGDIGAQFSSSLHMMLSEYAGRISAVAGNCDTDWDKQLVSFPLPIIRRIPYCGRTIMVTHGHHYSPSKHPLLKPGDIFISGHSHMPRLDYDAGQDIVYLNPGSVSSPRGSYKPSYALITCDHIKIRELKSLKLLFERQLNPVQNFYQ